MVLQTPLQDREVEQEWKMLKGLRETWFSRGRKKPAFFGLKTPLGQVKPFVKADFSITLNFLTWVTVNQKKDSFLQE